MSLHARQRGAWLRASPIDDYGRVLTWDRCAVSPVVSVLLSWGMLPGLCWSLGGARLPQWRMQRALVLALRAWL